MNSHDRTQRARERRLKFPMRTRAARRRARWKRQQDPNKRLADEVRRKLSRAVRGQLKDREYELRSTTAQAVMKDLGCSLEYLLQYLESQFDDLMTWGQYGRDGWHIDHVRPLASFNLLDPDQRRVACHVTNLQPLWSEVNLSKGSKII